LGWPDAADGGRAIPGARLTAAKVRAAVEAVSAKLESLGYSVRSLYVDDGKTAEVALGPGGYPPHASPAGVSGPYDRVRFTSNSARNSMGIAAMRLRLLWALISVAYSA
jgi:hypothetical protein